jgi:hypothetical protein
VPGEVGAGLQAEMTNVRSSSDASRIVITLARRVAANRLVPCWSASRSLDQLVVEWRPRSCRNRKADYSAY